MRGNMKKILILTSLFLGCVSHSKMINDPNVPMLCKYSLECMAYNEKNPVACSNLHDLCAWVSRETICAEKSKDESFTEKGKFSKREVYLDCMTRTK